MANYAVVTKVIIHNKAVADADTVAGSYAKEVSDYLESVTDTKTIRSIHSVELASSGSVLIIDEGKDLIIANRQIPTLGNVLCVCVQIH